MEPLTKGPVCCAIVTAARTHLNTWSQSPSSASQSLYSPSRNEGTTYGSVGVILPAGGEAVPRPSMPVLRSIPPPPANLPSQA